MPKRSKGYQEIAAKLDKAQLYAPDEAFNLIKDTARAKFDETVELHIRLGVDPKKSDQQVRGTVVLPHGTGKTPKVIVFTKGEKAKEAEDAGAFKVGADDLIGEVKEGWADFDVAVSTPDMMAQLGKELGKILGPKMPHPKAGTVSMEIGRTVKELLSGKVQYRTDKLGIIHTPIGKVSFGPEKLFENFSVLMDAVIKAKPTTAKGSYLKSLTLSPTMGAGIKIDPQKAQTALQGK